MKTIIVETFNGEGYSEPVFRMTPQRNHIKTIEAIEEARLTFGDDYLEEQVNGDREGDVILTYDNEEDQGSIHIMDLPTNEFYIVKVSPQVNEVKFYSKMPTMETALETLKDIVHDKDFSFDEYEIEEYDGEDFFGSHGEDEFLYFKIVQG